MGIIPVWGFQMLIAITLSIFFKLNKTLVIIAANISIPPMIPFIIFFSHLTGALWMGDQAQYFTFDQEITLELMRDSFLQYVLGAITLAIISGLFFAMSTWGLLTLLKRKRN